MKFNLRLLYLYLFSFIGLLISTIGAIQLVDLALKVYVFKVDSGYQYAAPSKLDASGNPVSMSDEEIANQKRMQEEETKRQRQTQATNTLAMLIVGIPLYKYHWNLIKKEGKKK